MELAGLKKWIEENSQGVDYDAELLTGIDPRLAQDLEAMRKFGKEILDRWPEG